MNERTVHDAQRDRGNQSYRTIFEIKTGKSGAYWPRDPGQIPGSHFGRLGSRDPVQPTRPLVHPFLFRSTSTCVHLTVKSRGSSNSCANSNQTPSYLAYISVLSAVSGMMSGMMYLP